MRGPRIALWGAFDVEDGGRLATRRVIEAELCRRLPGAVVTAFAPLGSRRPLALDGGRPAEPLSATGGSATGRGFDCILVCTEDALAAPERAAELWGDAGLAAPLRDPPDAAAVGCPVIRLDVAHPDGPVPPPALLLPRLLDERLLEARAGLLRLLGSAWDTGRVLTVAGDRALLSRLDALAAALIAPVDGGEVSVQLVASGRLDGEDEFAAALERALDGRCRRVPGVATVEDHAAVIATSSAYAGPPGTGLWLAAALGIPAAAFTHPGPPGGALLDELGIAHPPEEEIGAALRGLCAPSAPRPDAGGVIARVDGHLDRLAAAALAGMARTPVTRPPLDAVGVLREACESLGRRLFAERRALQSERDRAVRDLEEEVRALREEADRLRAELRAARTANDLIVGSRTWRYTQPVRDTLARVRERRR